jgi:hypothetical protein
MFGFPAMNTNEDSMHLQSLAFMGETRDSSFGVPPSGGPGKSSRPVADRLKPELQTLFIPPQITPNGLGTLNMTKSAQRESATRAKSICLAPNDGNSDIARLFDPIV